MDRLLRRRSCTVELENHRDRALGELFVHRNVANVVEHTDVNCLSVLQYAIDVLRVKHVVVVGHYGCGSIRSAMSSQSFGLIDNWLRYIRDVYADASRELAADPRLRRAREPAHAELNVEVQVANLCSTTIVQDAWRRGQQVDVHGWIYALEDGLLRDLHVSEALVIDEIAGRVPDHQQQPAQLNAAVTAVSRSRLDDDIDRGLLVQRRVRQRQVLPARGQAERHHPHHRGFGATEVCSLLNVTSAHGGDLDRHVAELPHTP